jgi:SPP1 family predicted phage head-tail adaptor
MPGAGELDRCITFERSTSVPNAFNEPVETWSPFLTVSAQRKDVSDGERLAAGQVGSSLRSRFVVRSSERTRAIEPVNRIAYDNAVWNIEGIKETTQGRRRFLEVTAVKDAD